MCTAEHMAPQALRSQGPDVLVCRCLTFGSSCWHVLEWKLTGWWSSPVVRTVGRVEWSKKLRDLDLVTLSGFAHQRTFLGSKVLCSPQHVAGIGYVSAERSCVHFRFLFLVEEVI